jgi:hypothetical protein
MEKQQKLVVHLDVFVSALVLSDSFSDINNKHLSWPCRHNRSINL